MLKRLLFYSSFFLVYFNVYSLDTLKLTAPDLTVVNIIRDEFGVPHIEAKNESALFFAQGFAVANDRTIQLETYRRTSTGTMSEIGLLLNADYTEFDQLIRKSYYQKSELQAMYSALDIEIKSAIASYSAGINRFLDSVKINPAKFKHFSLAQLEMIGLKIQPWEPLHTVAIMVYFARTFGSFGGNELTRLEEFKTKGTVWFEKNNPINDPKTFTTIPDTITNKIISNIQNDFNIDFNLVKQINEKRTFMAKTNESLHVPNKFGSFAVIASPTKSQNNSALLLGCPQMGTPVKDEVGPVNEVELSCPTYHCGGIALTGSPFILIGRNEKIAWTFTSGLSDNMDIFIDSTDFKNMKTYYTNQWIDINRFDDTVKVLKSGSSGFYYENVYTPIYRTIHGTVIAEDKTNNYIYSLKSTFNNREHFMFTGLYNSNKSKTAKEFENLLKTNPMSFNSFLIDGNKDIYYWHTGFYVDRSDGIDPRLPRKGDGTQEWKGLMTWEELPKDSNNKQGYYVNWNNKPATNWNNGDNISWTSTNYLGTNVEKIENYIKPIQKLSYEQIKNVPFAVNDHGTYQQSVEMFGNDYVVEENILPPGQSEFRNINGEYSVHLNDQWGIFNSWKFKEWYFGSFPTSSVEDNYKINNVNFPNPFTNSIEIRYFVPSYSLTTIEIFDNLGQKITILQNDYQSFGEYIVNWNGCNSSGNTISSGYYLLKISTANKSYTTKIIKY